MESNEEDEDEEHFVVEFEGCWFRGATGATAQDHGRDSTRIVGSRGMARRLSGDIVVRGVSHERMKPQEWQLLTIWTSLLLAVCLSQNLIHVTRPLGQNT